MVGKKKRGHPDVEELLARPWCYYCERDFDDLKILISHQKAKHFKCERCGRRLNTAGGLSVHMNQVHKETLTNVDNSLANRQGLEVEIFGMEGIPEDVLQAHNQRIIAGFYQAEAERRAATGNSGPGGAGASQPKKPKFEAPSDLKKKLAEHRAKKAEQAAAGGSSGGNTPMAAENSPAGQSPSAFSASPYPPLQAAYGNTQGAAYGSFSQEPYTQPAVAYQQPIGQQPAFPAAPGSVYQTQYSPSQQYPPSFPQTGFPQSGFQGSPPGSFNGYQPQPHMPPGGLPNRPPSLPPAPGLPRRPTFGAPQAQPYQMQQMHQGPPGSWGAPVWNGYENSATSTNYPTHPQGFPGEYPPANASSVDDLISGAAREADDIDEIIRMAEAGIKPPKKGDILPPPPSLSLPLPLPLPLPPIAIADASVKTEDKLEPPEKKSKKEKPIKMIYSDKDMSPEERMAQMPRYAFIPDGKAESSLVEAASALDVASNIDA